MKSVMMRIESSDAHHAATSAAQAVFEAGYGPLLEEREEACSWAWLRFRDDVEVAREELEYWLDYQTENEEQRARAVADAWEAHDRKVVELEEKRDAALAAAHEKFDAAVAALAATRDAAWDAAHAQRDAVWAAARAVAEEENWKIALRRGDWLSRQALVGRVPVDHPIFRRLLHDPDPDVRITAAAHEIALRSQSA